MGRAEGKKGLVLPVVVDTLDGRRMRNPAIVKKNYNTLSTLRKPHLLSGEHKCRRKDLPY